MAEFNLNCLKHLPNCVAITNADHNCHEASTANEEIAGGLHSRLHLCEGARVMLTSNLWTEKGLVNGAMGTIVAILYKTGCKPPSLPEAVVIQMDKYDGPTWGGERCVPISPIERTWPSSYLKSNATTCKRRQLPLHLVWAITVHKSQRPTLDKAVIDIGQRDFAPGITYVALSRVRNLDDCLIQSFDFQRIAHLNKSKSYKLRSREDRRLAKLAKRTESIFSANNTMVYVFSPSQKKSSRTCHSCWIVMITPTLLTWRKTLALLHSKGTNVVINKVILRTVV